MLIGYARVSTQDQNLELQLDALTKSGCQKVFEDTISGTRADRPGLGKALEMLREGDTLVVWKLDRLGRSVKQLVELVSDLHKQNVQFKSLTDSIDTGTPSGRFFFHVMASLAEMERDLIVERTRAGLDVARQLGRKWSDVDTIAITHVSGSFNPRSREGSDHSWHSCPDTHHSFNPRSREGSDRQPPNYRRYLYVSIHAPVKGATHITNNN